MRHYLLPVPDVIDTYVVESASKNLMGCFKPERKQLSHFAAVNLCILDASERKAWGRLD